MLITYPVILGVIISYIAGGRLQNLIYTKFRWIGLVFLSFLIQLIIFSGLPVDKYLPEQAIEGLHYFTYLLLFVFVARNIRIPGILPIGAGILLNALAIFLNGGYMPTFPENMKNTSQSQYAAILEQSGTSANSSAITGDTLLPWLGDIFYIPSGVPFSNVFSIGDILIGIGVIIYLVINTRKSGGTT